jgi:hypothetical protein
MEIGPQNKRNDTLLAPRNAMFTRADRRIHGGLHRVRVHCLWGVTTTFRTVLLSKKTEVEEFQPALTLLQKRSAAPMRVTTGSRTTNAMHTVLCF